MDGPMEGPEGEDIIELLLRERPKQPRIDDGVPPGGVPGDGGVPPGGGDDRGGHSSHSSWHLSQNSSDDSSSSKESSLFDELSELGEDDKVPWVGRDIEVDTSQRIIQIFQGTWNLNNEVYYTVKDLLLNQGDNCTVTDQVLDDLKRQNKIFREAYRSIMALICDDDVSIVSL